MFESSTHKMSLDSRISLTAHYTSYVWFRNGLSHPVLTTGLGRAMHAALLLPNTALRAFGRADLDANLLSRHRLIDDRLEQAVSTGRISCVIEIAAGLSARGLRFARRHPQLRYIEGDLPPMAARKLRALDRASQRRPNHDVIEMDALADGGARSLSSVASLLDARRGLAIITEGLINYFDRDTVEKMWRRIARVLARFPTGLYLSDVLLANHGRSLALRGFNAALATVTGARLQTHYEDLATCRRALASVGFDGSAVLTAGANGRELLRVVEAWSRPSTSAAAVGR